MPAQPTPDWQHWGKLRERYETRARSGGPYRLLALDGGGIRGLITLGVLASLEQRLAERKKDPNLRLSQFFDCIGGTSTGAIIATGLARGMSVSALLKFYKDFALQVFKKRKLFERWKALYQNGPLEQQLKKVFEDPQDLSPENLECLLVVVTRNATTDSAWPLSSNPWAKYNDKKRPDCNLNIPQWKIVRASTAAPVYFPPETIAWDPNDEKKSFVFVDGGTTAYNCPAFVMVRMATHPAYRLNWPMGEKKMLVVSLGTGSAPKLGATVDDPDTNVIANLVNTLGAVMNQAQVDQDMNCRSVGRCTYGSHLDNEFGDGVPRDADGQKIPLTQDLSRAFLYARYDAALTRKGLDELGLKDINPDDVSKLDAVEHVEALIKIGEKVGERVDLNDFGTFV
jgi:predicted acylesterase/phospholipase RssA